MSNKKLRSWTAPKREYRASRRRTSNNNSDKNQKVQRVQKCRIGEKRTLQTAWCSATETAR